MTNVRIQVGRVTAFDVAAGLGAVTDDDGRRYRFHCVEIADGSRHIDIDVPVAFVIVDKLGAGEAAAVTACMA